MAGRSFLTYNIHDGGMEAVVHGLGRGLLRVEDYNNLAQCDTLEDMKIHLGATDYGNFLQNEATLTSRVITEKALERIVDDFMWIRTNSAWPLSEFMDFITYEYQIANVLKLIQGARSGRGTLELIYKCHPLGLFEGIGALTAATSMDDVYEIVLIDSPIGRFFQASERHDFDENTMEYMRSLLQKNYLEQYYEFCKRIGGDTWETMQHILDFEADRFVITLTRNTYGSKDFHKDDRLKLYPQVGTLVDIHDELAATEDDDALKERLRPYPEYMDIIAELAGGLDDSSTSSLEAKFMERSVQLHKNSLSRQFQYGSFYSIFKLRELEANNLMWIAECITQGMRHRVNEYIPIY